MANRPTRLVRVATVALTVTIGALLSAPPASARVDIVPDHAAGGDTETFDFRLANERLDTTSTKLQLVFPQDPPIAYAKVEPFPGWTMTINPRPLNPPVKVGDRVVDQVVDSVVIQGGVVQPHQFEQFEITLGPLPRNGQLVFQSIQTFGNGQVERLTTAPTPGQTTPAAPVITIGNGVGDTVASAPPSQASAGGQDANPAPAIPRDTNESTPGATARSPLTLLWVALGVAVLVIAGVALRARARKRRLSAAPAESDDPEVTEVLQGAAEEVGKP